MPVLITQLDRGNQRKSWSRWSTTSGSRIDVQRPSAVPGSMFNVQGVSEISNDSRTTNHDGFLSFGITKSRRFRIFNRRTWIPVFTGMTETPRTASPSEFSYVLNGLNDWNDWNGTSHLAHGTARRAFERLELLERFEQFFYMVCAPRFKAFPNRRRGLYTEQRDWWPSSPGSV